VGNPQAAETLKRLRKETAEARPGETAVSTFLRWFLADPAGRPRLP